VTQNRPELFSFCLKNFRHNAYLRAWNVYILNATGEIVELVTSLHTRQRQKKKKLISVLHFQTRKLYLPHPLPQILFLTSCVYFCTKISSHLLATSSIIGRFTLRIVSSYMYAKIGAKDSWQILRKYEKVKKIGNISNKWQSVREES
jgi:hypothetical protein